MSNSQKQGSKPTKLKPCPHCGKEVGIYEIGEKDEPRRFFFIMGWNRATEVIPKSAKRCICYSIFSSGDFDADDEKARKRAKRSCIEAWNTRAEL